MLERTLQLLTPKGLCIGGNAVAPHSKINEVYDVLFYETEWYRPEIAHHKMIRHAFGINTNIYYTQAGAAPEPEYDVVVVGHFLPWKRTWKIAEKPGQHKLAIGEVYHNIEASVKMSEHLRSMGVEVSMCV